MHAGPGINDNGSGSAAILDIAEAMRKVEPVNTVTGAEGIKTAAQVALYGGTAGQQYDPCYHQACDTFANNNNQVLDMNSDAIAFATLT